MASLDEILRQVHRVYESDMLPLTALKTHEDVEKYAKRTGSALQIIPFAMKCVNNVYFPEEIEEDVCDTKESFAAALRTNRLVYAVTG